MKLKAADLQDRSALRLLTWLFRLVLRALEVRTHSFATAGRRTCYTVVQQGRFRVKLEDYKTVLYRQEDGSWVAEIPAISGCYALMPTREEALVELYQVFEMIATEYREKGLPLPADTTEIVQA